MGIFKFKNLQMDIFLHTTFRIIRITIFTRLHIGMYLGYYVCGIENPLW